MTKIDIVIKPSLYALKQYVNYLLRTEQISNATVNVQQINYAGVQPFMAVITYEEEVE